MSYKLKIGFFALFFAINLYSKSYVLENQNQILDKTADFIETLSNEVYKKTGVDLYIVALESLEGMNLQEREWFYQKNLNNPYVILFFAKKEKKIDIITTYETQTMFDKKEVYWDYIVPLIPNSDKELTQQNVSAFLLNGFMDIADRIAQFHKVELEHSFSTTNKGIEVTTKMILYLMLFVLLVLFAFVCLRRSK
ncbi:TPM domain-containing protein [Helicobacter mesocricetorum]|uniref:TPM domain-containing protein n=1 Tax=Helicobacter mesocricetorum TaxID=87012 RepID=UPI000CF06FCD|nr:TPM domain-containing protein [Helicobacter mesocricetorum]